MHTTELYFEAHVTVAPIDDICLSTTYNNACQGLGFRVAELYMKKKNGDLVPSNVDMFCTARGQEYDNLRLRTELLVSELLRSGIKVLRYKIENTLLDVRIKADGGIVRT